jgi:PAS domain-containing protein
MDGFFYGWQVSEICFNRNIVRTNVPVGTLSRFPGTMPESRLPDQFRFAVAAQGRQFGVGPGERQASAGAGRDTSHDPGTLVDISQQKAAEAAHNQAQRALGDSETRYRRLVETAKDGILILDSKTGQIADVNPFLIEMFGYTHGEFVGKKLWEIGPFKDIPASRCDTTSRSNGEHHDYDDSGNSAANPNYSDEREHHEVQAPSQEGEDGEANNDHYHASAAEFREVGLKCSWVRLHADAQTDNLASL